MADPATQVTAIYKADVYTGEITKLTDLPKGGGMGVATINADETLGAGTINDSDNATEYGANVRRALQAGITGAAGATRAR